MTETSPDHAIEAYRFRTSAPDDPDFGEGRRMGFQGGSKLDELMRRDFTVDHEPAASDALYHWRGCLGLFQGVTHHKLRKDLIDYAVQHHEMPARFGSFPYRNEILGGKLPQRR